MDSQKEDEKRGKAMSDTNDMTEQLPALPDTVDKFMGQVPFDLMHYELAAFGGAVSCSVTHSGATSVDIVNSQVQLESAKYTSFISVDKNTISAEGSGALSTDEMTTFQCFQCYFVQRWFKCGGVEICKTRFAMGVRKQNAKRNRDSSTLGGPRRCRVRSRCLPVSLRGLPYQVHLGSQLRKWGAGHWAEVCCRERCDHRPVL